MSARLSCMFNIKVRPKILNVFDSIIVQEKRLLLVLVAKVGILIRGIILR